MQPSDFFFTFHVMENLFFGNLHKMKGSKTGKKSYFNEKYFQGFLQRPFWYKKVFSEQHFSKT